MYFCLSFNRFLYPSFCYLLVELCGGRGGGGVDPLGGVGGGLCAPRGGGNGGGLSPLPGEYCLETMG